MNKEVKIKGIVLGVMTIGFIAMCIACLIQG